MTNLKLITTEKFGEVDCNFYRNMNDDMLLTREQIGTALEYSNPQKAIDNIHKRHRDRLDNLSVTLKLRATDGKEYDTTLYSERGIMEICRWSNKSNANRFMDWVWDIVEKYRNDELNNPNMQQFSSILSYLTTTLSNMNDRLGKLEEDSTKKSLPEKKYSRWKTKTFEKLKALLSYTNANSDQNLKLSQVMHLVIKETEDTYDIDISDYAEMYKEEFSLESNPYALDVINHYKNIRDMFTLTLDSTMERLHIQNKRDRTENIFDVLAARLEKEDNNATKSNITSITTNVKKYLS
ncbi:MAG: BRO family protein [Bacteroidaceae bacterium]